MQRDAGEAASATTDTDGNGYDLHGYGLYSPGELFQRVVSQDIQRFIGSAQANWRPLSWMQNDATIGIDLADRDNLTLNRLNEGPASGTTRDRASVTDGTDNDRNFSAKVTSNSTWQAKQLPELQDVARRRLRQHRERRRRRQRHEPSARRTERRPDGDRESGSKQSLPTATKTLGLYVQELASIRDRLFITGAVRTDQNSAFGTNFQRVFYPKASVSYIISDESFFPKIPKFLDQLRLRYAYGASGVQPGATTTFRTYSASTANIGNPGAGAGTDRGRPHRQRTRQPGPQA